MKRIYLILLAFIAALASCVNDAEYKPSSAVPDDVPVEFGSSSRNGYGGMTKSGKEETENPDSLFSVTRSAFESTGKTKSVSVVTADNLTQFYLTTTKGASEEIVGYNVPFTGSKGQNYSGGMVWPAQDEGYHFYASNMKTGETQSTCNTIDVPASTDVVYAYNGSPTFRELNTLNFHHVFARIGSISIKGPEGMTVSLVECYVMAPTSGSFNIKEGAWTAGPGEYLTLGTSNDMWVVPGTYEMTAFYDISDGTTSFPDVIANGSVTLLADKINNITINVDRSFDYELAIEPESLQITKGEASSLSAIYRTLFRGTPIAEQNVTSPSVWKSNDTEIATVSTGMVTGTGVGSTTVTAEYGYLSAHAEVVVIDNVDHYDAPYGLSISCNDIGASGGSVSVGSISGTCSQRVYYKSGDSEVLTNVPYTVSWSSAVSGGNLGTTATPRTKKGTLTLTYSANGKSNTASADVYQQENRIESSTYAIADISANPSSVGAAASLSSISGGSGTKTNTWTSGGTDTGSFTPDRSVTSPATISGSTVSIPANTGAQRAFTVTYSYTGATSRTCTITQSGDSPTSEKEYDDLSVSISASPVTLTAENGQTSVLSYSASYKERTKLSSGAWGEWETKSGTPVISGSAAGFTRNGTAVTASANQSASSRSVTYYADFLIGGKSATQQSVTITQNGDSVSYYDAPVVSFSYSPDSFTAASGTAYPSVSYSQTVHYVSGATGTITSGGEIRYEEVAAVTGFSLSSNGIVNVGANAGAARSYSVKATVTMNGKSGDGIASVSQSSDAVSYYDAPVVSFSYSPDSFSTAGGTAYPSVSYSQTVHYVSGATGTITSGGEIEYEEVSAVAGFTLNSDGSVTVGNNAGTARSYSVRVTVTLNSKSGSDTAEINQGSAIIVDFPDEDE